MNLEVTLRSALPSEVQVLDRIALEAKAHWGYARSQLAAWEPDLRTAAETIARWPTVAAESGGQIVGFAQLDPTCSPWMLVSLWVLPSHMRRSVGRGLLREVISIAAASGQDRLHIDADPNALDFYLACGARVLGAEPAPIPGAPDRVRPQLELPCRGA